MDVQARTIRAMAWGSKLMKTLQAIQSQHEESYHGLPLALRVLVASIDPAASLRPQVLVRTRELTPTYP